MGCGTASPQQTCDAFRRREGGTVTGETSSRENNEPGPGTEDACGGGAWRTMTAATPTRSRCTTVHEVTFAEWDACVAAGGCDGYSPDDRDRGRGARPVMSASWDHAQAYVEWLSGETGAAYRLPSQSEWEYATRAGTTTRYSWGDEIGANRANCEGCGSAWDDRQTALVGSFRANGFGLHDLHGNVWEWVADCWNGS